MSTETALIFDLDDTLYPESEYVFSGFAAVAYAFEATLGPPDEVIVHMRRLFHSRHRRRVFDVLLNERGLVNGDELVPRMISTYRTHHPTIAFYVDAEAALNRFRPRARLGVITDGPGASQNAKIEALGLRPRVDAIILTDDLGRDYAKPHPRAFEDMSRRLSVEPSRCTYVGDNPAKDFLAPNALGWLTVRIKHPNGIYRDTPAAEGGKAHHVIDTLDCLDAIVARRNST